MNDKLENKLAMYDTVKDYSVTNADGFATPAALPDALGRWVTIVNGIHAKKVLADLIITGKAASKKVLRGTMCNLTLAIAEAGFAFATKKGDLDLQAQFNYTENKLKKLKDEDVYTACVNVIAAAEGVIDDLDEYGILPANLSDAGAAVGAYLAKKQSPRDAIANKKTLNSALKQLFKDADAVLKKEIDKLVKAKSRTAADFVAGYLNARIIIDRGAGGGAPTPPAAG